ncbi:MarR family winged helix-turn-helix transcriptional regulator [Falsiroseomonas selenitidurans]|uniref:MarR family transcriptional regulator n=1 Tax=Falsiroseomonas selenitidurans TaxID=2716335 RepID=A0ABX1E7B5_9PROT|nr:helix-turn-helix domain-containing protein [Falsiroseomonas selenitidurans]NKC32826.1 MarR family transcriptional regulator [Falsiroseomonas selenitidurans]
MDTTPTPEAWISDIAVEVFRLNGRLLAAGDRVVAPLGLTSARWQVLGAVALAPHPGPTAHVARAMGLTRQNVRRIVQELVAEGLLELAPNPNHRRAPLVQLTAPGQAAYAAASAAWAPRAAALAEAVDPALLASTLATLRLLRDRLQEPEEAEPA